MSLLIRPLSVMPPKTSYSVPDSYCVKCRTKTATGGAVHHQSGHRHMLKGTCASCGTSKSQFVGAGFWDDLGKIVKKVAPVLGTVATGLGHPNAGKVLGKLPGLFGDGVKAGRRKKGGGLYRTSAGSISRVGGNLYTPFDQLPQNKKKAEDARKLAALEAANAMVARNAGKPRVTREWIEARKAARAKTGGAIRHRRVGKGVLDDELTTDLKLRR